MRIIFATNNQNKVEEIKSVVPENFSIITLKDADIDIDIPEPHDTLEDNAKEKAHTIYKLTGENCFSEDTGLEVACLNGAPGVKSARYAGETKSFQDNINKLLLNLKGKENCKAQFRTVICLLLNGEEFLFEGICKGEITPDQKGTNGFGYDPVFIPEGATKTFAEMTMAEKNEYSHRKKAVNKLVVFLNSLQTNK